MRNIALIIAYDGSDFYGWQKTKAGPSIEQMLEFVLEQVLQHQVVLQAASRTDRGVHAEGQCINFFTHKKNSLAQLLKSLNALLPLSIRILKIAEMPAEFHPTLHAEKKEYHYHVSLGSFQFPLERFFAWHIPYQLDVKRIKEASSYFIGHHDFSSFCNQRKNINYNDKIRRIHSLKIIEIDQMHLMFQIQGANFLYKMVRNIVGTLIDTGLGKIAPQEIATLLLQKSRIKAGITAPAHGLTLRKIYYPKQFDFELSCLSYDRAQ